MPRLALEFLVSLENHDRYRDGNHWINFNDSTVFKQTNPCFYNAWGVVLGLRLDGHTIMLADKYIGDGNDIAIVILQALMNRHFEKEGGLYGKLLTDAYGGPPIDDDDDYDVE